MIRTKTVLVVGAGASSDFDFPIGSALLNSISADLAFRFEHSWEPLAGNRALLQVLRQSAIDDGGLDLERLKQLIQAGHLIRRSAVGGDSIDNVIDQLDDKPDVPITGKLAIAFNILQAEAKSPLAVRHGNTPPLDKFSNTWLFQLQRLLRTDVRRTAIASIFANLKIITFNYDRTIEQFLPIALASIYHLTAEEAEDIVRALVIYHPYGQVGLLPWMAPTRAEGNEYGDARTERIAAISDQILTFGQSVDEGEELKAIRHAVDESSNVVFLGFGFHRQNMRLLTSGQNRVKKRVWATCLNMPQPAVREAESLISQMCQPPKGAIEPSISMMDVDCRTLLSECFMPLTG